jgi:hypothetical protein
MSIERILNYPVFRRRAGRISFGKTRSHPADNVAVKIFRAAARRSSRYFILTNA